MRGLLASPLGFLIGLSLGALGGGGSILAVPVLVYVAGQSARAATATSLVLVTLTAVVGIVPHWRAGRVRVVPGLVFGTVGVFGAVVGSRLNQLADPDVLLLLFAGVMFVAAAAMWRSARRRRSQPTAESRVTAVQLNLRTALRVAGAGSLVGLLTGFFGVGGGFVIVPMLVLALGFSMPEAVGTSLLVIVINSLVALGVRAGAGGVEWAVVVPFALSSMAGVVVGGRLAGRRDPATLQQAFAVLMIVVASYTAVTSLLALV